MPDDLSALIDGLNGPDAAVRARSAEQLSRLGTDARGAAVPLVRTAGDESEDVREWATAALEELGPPANDDLPALAELLADDSSDVGYWAATLLGRLEDRAAPAVNSLAAALSNSPHVNVKQRVAWALGKIGPPADAARPALEKAAASDDPRLARLAGRALENIGG